MKGRSKRATGGTNLADDDLKTKNQRYTYQSKVNDEAEERKSGGRAGRKSGGMAMGCAAKPNAGRKPRKNGGRAGADSNPFSSARNGTSPKGHSVEMGSV